MPRPGVRGRYGPACRPRSPTTRRPRVGWSSPGLKFALGTDAVPNRCTRQRGAGPGSIRWDPTRQRAVIVYLAQVGADPNAAASGGVTPLHRAVRNRCSVAVEALLQLGADPHLANDNGSTAFDLARWTTGRGGTGTIEARAEQQSILELLARAG